MIKFFNKPKIIAMSKKKKRKKIINNLNDEKIQKIRLYELKHWNLFLVIFFIAFILYNSFNIKKHTRNYL